MVSNVSQLKSFAYSKNKTAGKRQSGVFFKPEQVWISKEVADHPLTIQICERLGDVPVDIIDDSKFIKRPRELSDAKRQLMISRNFGEAFKSCQGIGEGHVCCKYKVIDLISGCPMDCSYCILQSYLANNPITTIYVNLEEIFQNISIFLKQHSDSFFRIGTGELSDSLALDDITDYSKLLIHFFSTRRNALLELKTKTDRIDHLLDLPHRNRTVLAWSVNPQNIISHEERFTATLEERLIAAKKAVSAGYMVAFHFDPIIVAHGNKQEIDAYKDVIDKILNAVEPKHIAWMSFGMLRYPPDLKNIAMRRFPKSHIFTGELIPSGPKVRYLRFLREEVLSSLWNHAVKHIPKHKLYLCMETPLVWKKVDPSITDDDSLECRLTRSESVKFDYKSSYKL
ncbi:MAG: radical SAM protein [Pseudomonadota bacterium]